jgi:hypothetical protein
MTCFTHTMMITPSICKSCIFAAWPMPAAGSTLVRLPPATCLSGRRRTG